MDYPPKVQDLITAFRLLPTVGPRSAERFAQWFVEAPLETKQQLEAALRQVRETITPCPDCGFYSEGQRLCHICSDPTRDASVWCIVQDAAELIKIERSGTYRGLYHILGGLLDPLEGIEPEHLAVESLLMRLKKMQPKEVILALGTDVESETTVLYLTPLLKQYAIKVTRLAFGLPAGGGIAYVDSVTLGYALSGRREI
ncbi:MAG: recombination mediator RecR [Methylacidiphilales bacterium]|nr:recombination mediator RecR [Candidatus Methylacidiphilales bacterium]MDW8350169.1 recombination mediator RecR [Verrucomicrobiae bacterium]